MVKTVNHANNCIFCHDPHAAKPRIVRDGLIQALTRKDSRRCIRRIREDQKFEVKDLGVRGYTRKIAMLESYDSKLQCAQCHVEYNCNPGIDPKTGAPIGMADQRTNTSRWWTSTTSRSTTTASSSATSALPSPARC